MRAEQGKTVYSIDQTAGLIDMLTELNLLDQPVRSSPMPFMDLLLSDSTVLNEVDTASP